MPGKHQPGCPCQGCGSGGCCQTKCGTYKIPQKDLKLTITVDGTYIPCDLCIDRVPYNDTSTFTLTYKGASWSWCGGIDSFYYKLECALSKPQFSWGGYTADVDCVNVGGMCLSPVNFQSTSISSNPFMMTLVDSATGPPPNFWKCPLVPSLYPGGGTFLGNITYTISDASPPDPTKGQMCQTFVIFCCGPKFLAGAVVTVFESQGGNVLTQGTTNAGGHIYLTWTGKPGTYWVTITTTDPLFQDFAGPLKLVCEGTVTTGLDPVNGYYCCSPCCEPLPDSIALTDSVLLPGGAEAVYQTSGLFQGAWAYFQEISFGANPPFCAAGSAMVAWVMQCSAVAAGSFPGSVDISVWVADDNGNNACPNGSNLFIPMRYIQNTPVLSCANTFNVSQIYNPAAATLAFSTLYGNAASTRITFSQ